MSGHKRISWTVTLSIGGKGLVGPKGFSISWKYGSLHPKRDGHDRRLLRQRDPCGSVGGVKHVEINLEEFCPVGSLLGRLLPGPAPNE